MGVGRVIVCGELPDLGALAVDVVAAHLTKENLPLAKEGLGLGAVGVADDIVNEPHALPGARAVGAKVRGQVLRVKESPRAPSETRARSRRWTVCAVTGCGFSMSIFVPRIRMNTMVSPSHPTPRMRSRPTCSSACKSRKRFLSWLMTGVLLSGVILPTPLGSLYSMTTPPYLESIRPPAKPYSCRPLTVSPALLMNSSSNLLHS